MAKNFDSLSQLPRPFGPFTLLRLIAQGGMGQVFLALRPGDLAHGSARDEVCVVKTVRTDLKSDREAVGRFLDEARVVQRLVHGKIVRTLDAGVIEKTYFLCLEFISGRNLRDVGTRAQQTGRRMPEEVIVHATIDVLEALAYAHSLKDKDSGSPLNIVHRDVSPHNIMVGFDGQVKLIDFGLAMHELKRELTRPGVMVGKLRYNAPEQVRDRALDGRSDVYSCGVVLYELFSGQRFYEGLTEEDVWRVAMKGDHRPSLYASLPGDLRRVLDVALHPDPRKRYADAGEMRTAVLEVARARGIIEVRRATGRFMTELFEHERRAEEEMISQATGIAEARTRLFKDPGAASLLSELSSQLADQETQVGGVDAAQLQRAFGLTHMVAPDALTVPPQRALELDSMQDDDDGAFRSQSDARHRSISGESLLSQELGSMPGVADAYDEGATGTDRSDDPSDDTGAPTVLARVRSNSLPGSVDATVAATPHTLGLRAAPPMDVDDAPVTNTSDTMNSVRSISASARTRESQRRPLPPLPPPSVRRTSLWLGLFGGALLLITGAAVVAALMMPKPGGPLASAPADVVEDAPPPQPVQAVQAALAVDAGVAVAAVDAALAPIDAESAGVDAGVVVVAAADAGVDTAEVKRVDEDLDDVRGQGGGKRASKKAKKPPSTELRTLKDQVDYLRRHCLERVACARATTEDAARLADLSPDETKALIAELPRCIGRCRRD